MCLAVYLASSIPLPLVEWSKERPAFYVAKLLKGEPDVRRQFALPYVYRVGSHEGCGCGFLRDGATGEDLRRTQEDYAKLAAYIAEARHGGADVQLFVCWEGDQRRNPEFREAFDISALNQDEFEFKERAMYSIS